MLYSALYITWGFNAFLDTSKSQKSHSVPNACKPADYHTLVIFFLIQGVNSGTCTASLHHLIVALHVGSNENNLCSETLPSVLEKLHRIWSSTSFFRVPENHSFWINVFAD